MEKSTHSPNFLYMENATIMNWVLNILIFSLPFSWYMTYSMYKDLKEKDKIIKLQDNMLKEKEKSEI